MDELKALVDGAGKRKKIRYYFSKNYPSKEILIHLIDTSNASVLSMAAKAYEFEKDIQEYLIKKGSASVRRAYTRHRKFKSYVEREFV
jgi:hypothetical protein